MILKRQENDNIIKAMYDSSNILASIYNNNTNDLDLIFKAGTKYRYSNVSKSDYMRFEIAESQGVIFNTHIRKYSFVKLDDVDVSKILNESEDLKIKENAALLEGKKIDLISQLKQLILIGSSSEKNTEFLTVMDTINIQINDILTFVNNN